jgi:hypothetical protein
MLRATIHLGELQQYAVLVKGPRAAHEVIVFATSREGAAEEATDKVKDEIRRGRRQRSWAGKNNIA